MAETSLPMWRKIQVLIHEIDINPRYRYSTFSFGDSLLWAKIISWTNIWLAGETRLTPNLQTSSCDCICIKSYFYTSKLEVETCQIKMLWVACGFEVVGSNKNRPCRVETAKVFVCLRGCDPDNTLLTYWGETTCKRHFPRHFLELKLL